MALAFSGKQEGVKQVPWFSLAEWYQTYNQVYSIDPNDQENAYKILLVWKARVTKLPVAIDCTLSILQVVLKDRDWMPKIDRGDLSTQYEEDLCLMYSTTIMRFLNHMSNIGQTKQVSLFLIAKQMNIPEWIVNLRHDTAHGHELPSIGVLRIAINTLLIWLHDEYWAPEAAAMQENYVHNVQTLRTMKREEACSFADIIELWTVVGLYIHARYKLVADVPDIQLKETLKDVFTYAMTLSEANQICKNTSRESLVSFKALTLKKCSSILLSEISRYLGKSKFILNKEDVILDVLLSNELFLPNLDLLNIFINVTDRPKLDHLPMSMIRFWEDIIVMLDDQKMVEILILKLNAIVDNERETRDRRRMSALWIEAIARSFSKLEVASTTFRGLKIKSTESGKKTSSKILFPKVKEEVERAHPSLRHSPWLSPMTIVPLTIIDKTFIKEIILNVNEYSALYIEPLLDLVRPRLSTPLKACLLKLIRMYQHQDCNDENMSEYTNEQIYTVDNLHDIYSAHTRKYNDSKDHSNTIDFLADRTIRNTNWEFASEEHNWSQILLGLLPWQIDSAPILLSQPQVPIEYHSTMLESEIVPGIIDPKSLRMQSKIDWGTVFKQKGMKDKEERVETNLMGRTIGIVKTVIK